LALLAATCSKIGGVQSEGDEQQTAENQQNQAVAQAIQQGSIRVVSSAMLQQMQEQARQAQVGIMQQKIKILN